MRAEDTREPAEKHRPLPSVDIPLLRQERRARVLKNAAVGTAVALGVVAAATTAVLVRWSSQSGHAADEPPKAPKTSPRSPSGDAVPTAAAPGAGVDAGAGSAGPTEEPPVTPGAVDRIVMPFGKAASFRQALADAHLDRDASQELETALKGVLDFRRCRPGDRMVFERDAQGRVLLFEYHPGPTQYVQATRGPKGELRAERVQVPIETKRLDVGGRVRTSLGDALEEAGLGRSLVGVFVSVFEGRANFSTDTRQGDAFRIIVDEQRIHGKLLQYGTVHALEYVGQRTGSLRAFWFEPHGHDGDYYDETGRAVQGGWIRTPLRYDHISSPFNMHRMHPILHRIMPHNGVDYAASVGTPVWAAADGEVTWARRKGANGNLVVIHHKDGYQTFYCHLSRFARGIHRGVHVKQRQIIGYVGSTGRSTGPHLHFSIKHNGKYLDPQKVLNGPGQMMSAALLPRFRREKRKLEAELSKIHVGAAPPGTGKGGAEQPVDEPMD